MPPPLPSCIFPPKNIYLCYHQQLNSMLKRIIPLILLLLGLCCTAFAANNVIIYQKKNTPSQPSQYQKKNTPSQPSQATVTPKKDNASTQSGGYLTFTAEADNSTFGISYTAQRPIKSSSYRAGELSETVDTMAANSLDAQYSLDNGQTWINFVNEETITLAKKGDKALLRGDNQVSGFSTFYRRVHFVMTGSISASGSVMSLIDGKGETKVIPKLSFCFEGLFLKCTSLTKAPALPATELAGECYYRMFEGCTSLKEAPALPATTLAESCYENMFKGCTSLTQAPKLPATTLAEECYVRMFLGCASLKEAPELPATTLESACYDRMFSKCTSLTKAPQLPATTLEELCYGYMFDSCISLTQAPELPATTLASKCYLGMFYDCTSLTQAPDLPATTLEKLCYDKMFAGCTNLTQAPDLPATKLEKWCYREMFLGCAKISSIKVNFINWGKQYSMKWDTDSWVSDVAPSGTFICPDILPKIYGDHKIPKGWKIIKN